MPVLCPAFDGREVPMEWSDVVDVVVMVGAVLLVYFGVRGGRSGKGSDEQ
jgi:threonine/homoserine/homoserine lactone efflux protein